MTAATCQQGGCGERLGRGAALSLGDPVSKRWHVPWPGSIGKAVGILSVEAFGKDDNAREVSRYARATSHSGSPFRSNAAPLAVQGGDREAITRSF